MRAAAASAQLSNGSRHKVYVKTLIGKILTIPIQESDLVDVVKARIQDAE